MLGLSRHRKRNTNIVRGLSTSKGHPTCEAVKVVALEELGMKTENFNTNTLPNFDVQPPNTPIFAVLTTSFSPLRAYFMFANEIGQRVRTAALFV